MDSKYYIVRAKYTPEEFIELTENAYNGQIIKRLKEAMPK